MHMQHITIYIYIHIFTYYIIYATILCFTLVLQASNILRRPCQKRGPFFRKGVLRAHAKTNQISSSVRTEPRDRLGTSRCTREIRCRSACRSVVCPDKWQDHVGSNETKIHLRKLMTNYISWGYWYHIVRQTPKSPIASKKHQLLKYLTTPH